MRNFGRERDVPGEVLAAAARRALSRCPDPLGHPNGCSIYPASAQLRVTVRPGVYVTLSLARAVYTAWNGPVSSTHDVYRACERPGCISPGHLAIAPRGTISTPSRRENHRAAMLRAGRKRRVYSEHLSVRLIRMVEGGAPIKQAAVSLGIGEAMANNLVRAAGGPRSSRNFARGTPKSPVCSRCGEQGHWRNRGCPEVAR